jgi:hypothetical protein
MVGFVSELVPGMAEAVEGRRRQRRLSPSAFADAAGVTVQGLAPVRKGVRRDYQDKIRHGVAAALQWPSNWYDRLLAGEDWTTFPTVEHAPVKSDAERIAALEELVLDLAEAVERLTAGQQPRAD